MSARLYMNMRWNRRESNGPHQELSDKVPTSLITNMAVEETGHSAAEVARFLGVKRMSVHEAVTRGKTLYAEYALLGQKRK